MTVQQQIMTVAMVVLGTVLTRAIPFLLFPAGKPMPRFIRYLGKALPPAVFGLLVIYCVKNVSLLDGTHGIPEMIAIAVTAILHIWKKNMFLSIAVGTASYMILIQFIF